MPNFEKYKTRIQIGQPRVLPPPNGAAPATAYFPVNIVAAQLGSAAALSADELSQWLLANDPQPGKKWAKAPSAMRAKEVHELVKLDGQLYWAIAESLLPKPPDPFSNTGNKKRLDLGAARRVPAGGDAGFLYFTCIVNPPDARDPGAPAVDALTRSLIDTAPGKVRKKPLGPTDGALEHELVAMNGELYWRRPVPPPPGYDNPTRDWLFYEAIFNHTKFQKQNQRLEMGSYLIPLDRVKIFVCEDIEPAALKVLTEAFLPDLTNEEVLARAAFDCPWKPKPKTSPPLSSASPTALVASRSVNQARLGLQVAMPFNFQDAGGEIATFAIGGTTQGHLGDPKTPLVHLDCTWPMWKSASRSCVCQLNPIKALGKDWPAPKVPQVWTVYSGETNVRDLKTLAAGDDYFKLSEDVDKKCFSVKTGVNFVGKVNQSGDNAGGKNRLETNSIDACLRSDLVTLFDRAAGRQQGADPHLLILKELLSITEFNADDPRELGDGMQVRDLSVLERDKHYLCPISIMYLDREMNSMTNRYHQVESREWVEFWRDAYAIPLGRAKALLLLRYAMQMGSPNAQNYLIEFKAGNDGNLDPTGRIVTRDLGDAQLHREVLWAVHGPEGKPPPVGGHPWTIDGGEALKAALIEEEQRKVARRLLPLVKEVCATIRKEREYPPVLPPSPKRDPQASLREHLAKKLTETLKAKSDKQLDLVFPRLKDARSGECPGENEMDLGRVLAAVKAANIAPDAKGLQVLADEKVAGDVTTAQIAMADEVSSPPVKYEFGVLREVKSYVMESGAVDPSRAYGEYAGVQLRWTKFSALTRGSNVASNSASTDQGIRDPGWQRVLEVNALWGQAHNRAFIETIESCLGLEIPVPWGDAYEPGRYASEGPGRYAALGDDQYETAGRYFDQDVKWEYVASSAVQAVLLSADGQAAIRDYHARKWAPL